MPQRAAPASAGQPSAIEASVRRVLEAIRPAVQADGGDLEFVGVSPEGVVRVRLLGACIGCPSSHLTLQMGIERNLKTYVPGVSRVEAVE
ncbi:MAG: NifU family protein [Phycisphaeraceae bacterium]|nr:NifU family protein [Phycisphaeraceae bacterium]